MNIDIGRYDDLVHSVYDSALEPAGRTNTIGAIAQGEFHALLLTLIPDAASGAPEPGSLALLGVALRVMVAARRKS